MSIQGPLRVQLISYAHWQTRRRPADGLSSVTRRPSHVFARLSAILVSWWTATDPSETTDGLLVGLLWAASVWLAGGPGRRTWPLSRLPDDDLPTSKRPPGARQDDARAAAQVTSADSPDRARADSMTGCLPAAAGLPRQPREATTDRARVSMYETVRHHMTRPGEKTSRPPDHPRRESPWIPVMIPAAGAAQYQKRDKVACRSAHAGSVLGGTGCGDAPRRLMHISWNARARPWKTIAAQAPLLTHCLSSRPRWSPPWRSRPWVHDPEGRSAEAPGQAAVQGVIAGTGQAAIAVAKELPGGIIHSPLTRSRSGARSRPPTRSHGGDLAGTQGRLPGLAEPLETGPAAGGRRRSQTGPSGCYSRASEGLHQPAIAWARRWIRCYSSHMGQTWAKTGLL